jgi:hypothetical protein
MRPTTHDDSVSRQGHQVGSNPRYGPKPSCSAPQSPNRPRAEVSLTMGATGVDDIAAGWEALLLRRALLTGLRRSCTRAQPGPEHDGRPRAGATRTQMHCWGQTVPRLHNTPGATVANRTGFGVWALIVGNHGYWRLCCTPVPGVRSNVGGTIERIGGELGCWRERAVLSDKPSEKPSEKPSDEPSDKSIDKLWIHRVTRCKRRKEKHERFGH